MTKSIQISRKLLIEYYEASTTPQREYLTKHFKLDGTTTDEAIRGLYEMACSKWKPRIKKNHPECFPEDSKYFDFLEFLGRKSLIEDEVADLLGMNRDFIQIRKASSEYGNRSFYLDSDYNWELIQDGDNKILIPTKKVK